MHQNMSEAGYGELAGSVFAPIGTAAVVLLASYAYFGAQWYIRHIFSSMGLHHVEGRSISATATRSSGAVTTPAGGLSVSEAFWNNDEGEAEIMKKEL